MNLIYKVVWQHKKLLAVLLAALVFCWSVLPLQARIKPNYGEALQKSILFYEAQQAGKLPDWNRVSWRGDSTPNDGADVGIDLTGGWFDAGDHVKFGFPMAASVTTLAWGGIEYYDAYQQSGQLIHLSRNIKWVTDYLLKAFANDTPGNYVLYGQVGNGQQDHQWWGPAEVIHYEMERPAYKIDTSCPGTELAAETSAAMSAASILFRKNGDTSYADLLVTKAERLYDFADRYRGVYSDCLKEASPFYKSFSGYQDELPWGAIWLHKAKKAQQDYNYSGQYLTKAIAEYQMMPKPYNYTFITDDKSYGVYLLLAQETGELEYQQRVEAWLDFWTIGYRGERIKYTPGGLAFLVEWGSLNLTASTSFLSFIYSDWLKQRGAMGKAKRYFDFGVSQINYILGDNPDNRSYMIGYGNNYPRNPHHRTAHGSWLNDMSNPPQSRNLVIGALVGGPDANEHWSDDRHDWVTNEVAIGYNASFTGALAKMYSEFGGQPLTKITFPDSEEPEIYVQSKIVYRGKNVTEIKAAIVNKSASPARGLEHAQLRINYHKANFNNAENITVSSTVNECRVPQAENVQGSVYYTVQVNCDNTVIYPGGESNYKKQIVIRLDGSKRKNNSLLSSLSSFFTRRGIEITDISLYDQEGQPIWQHSYQN